MTEIPEHLLQRSRERRAALGLAASGGGEEGAAAPAAPAAAVSAAPDTTASPAAAVEGAPVQAAVAAAPEPAGPTYVAAEAARKKGRIPVWALPALAALPVWALLYTGTFGDRSHDEGPVDPLELGQEVYAANCAACHGATGGGGVGPALAGGESALTFPEVEDQISWTRTGSGPFRGQPYGDPDREGGQRGPATGGMPGFSSLSDAEIEAVVQYERESL